MSCDSTGKDGAECYWVCGAESIVGNGSPLCNPNLSQRQVVVSWWKERQRKNERHTLFLA